MRVFLKLCLITALAALLSLAGCAPCPATPPPQGAEGSAILLSVRKGLDAAQANKAAATSPSYRRAVGHALALDGSSFWCESAALYDELTAFEQEAAAGGAPIPPELTEAIGLVKWAVDRAACSCPAKS